MNVELPNTGCNIISGPDSFYNYSPDGRTRSLYYIYQGKAFLSNVSTSNSNYNYNGTCLNTGDLLYSPESTVYFTHLAIFAFLFVLWLAIRAFFRPWWRVLR